MAKISSQQEMESFFPEATRIGINGPRLARVTGVDTASGQVSVVYLEGGDMETVLLSQPYVGKWGRIGYMPELDDVCVILRTMGRFPVIVAYLPPDYERQVAGKELDAAGNLRRLFPGDVTLHSSRHGEIYVGENIEISDKRQNRFVINSENSEVTVFASSKVIVQSTGTIPALKTAKVEIDGENGTVDIRAAQTVRISSGILPSVPSVPSVPGVPVEQVNLADGEKGCARDGDEVTISSDTAPGLMKFLQSKGYIGGPFKGKISKASDKVKVG